LERQMQHYYDFIANLNPGQCNTTRLNPQSETARQHIQIYNGEPLRCFLANKETPTCPICLEGITADCSSISVLPCQHIFHTECINTWWETHTECPTCRSNPADTPSRSESEVTTELSVPIVTDPVSLTNPVSPTHPVSPTQPQVNLKPIRIRRRDGSVTKTYVDFNQPISSILIAMGVPGGVLMLVNTRLNSAHVLSECKISPNDLLVEWVN